MTIQSVEWFAGRHMTPARETMASLLARVSESSGISSVQILSDQRNKPVVAARHEFVLLAYRAGFTCAEIGRFLGRDYTTIQYVMGKVK